MAGRRIVDLTLPLQTGMRGVDIRPKFAVERDGWNGSTLELYSHCGTHMDAPQHFFTGAEGIDAQSLETCVGPALVVDLSDIAPRELITVERMQAAAPNVAEARRVLIRTDWTSRHHGTDVWRDDLPRISRDLASWFVDQKVDLVGVEPPSVADVNNLQEVTDVHHTLLGGGVTIVEGLTNLHALQQSEVELVVLPLKVVGCDGAPVRAIAIESSDRESGKSA